MMAVLGGGLNPPGSTVQSSLCHEKWRQPVVESVEEGFRCISPECEAGSYNIYGSRYSRASCFDCTSNESVHLKLDPTDSL